MVISTALICWTVKHKQRQHGAALWDLCAAFITMAIRMLTPAKLDVSSLWVAPSVLLKKEFTWLELIEFVINYLKACNNSLTHYWLATTANWLIFPSNVSTMKGYFHGGWSHSTVLALLAPVSAGCAGDSICHLFGHSVLRHHHTPSGRDLLFCTGETTKINVRKQFKRNVFRL